MIRAPRRASIAFIILLVAAAGLALAMNLRRATPSTAEPFEKAPLALLTSLPIVFGEHFDLKSVGSPVLTALSRDFNVAPIGTTNAKELHNPLLLMAQPPAQTAENLVARRVTNAACVVATARGARRESGAVCVPAGTSDHPKKSLDLYARSRRARLDDRGRRGL